MFFQWSNLFKVLKGIKHLSAYTCCISILHLSVLYLMKLTVKMKMKWNISTHTIAVRIHYQHTWTMKNFKRNLSGRKKMTLDGNMDLHKWIKRTRNGNYLHKHKIFKNYWVPLKVNWNWKITGIYVKLKIHNKNHIKVGGMQSKYTIIRFLYHMLRTITELEVRLYKDKDAYTKP